MPTKGRQRLPKCRDVHDAIRDSEAPMPGQTETFTNYLMRVDWQNEPWSKANELLMMIGAHAKTQHDYLVMLSSIRDLFHRVDYALHEKWKG